MSRSFVQQVFSWVLHVTGDVLYGMLIAIAVLCFLVLDLGPHIGHYQVLTVLSGSMSPAVPEGSLIIEKPVSFASIHAGNIITFESPVQPNVLITHRVEKVLSSGQHLEIRTKGDANRQPDPWKLRLLNAPAWKVAEVFPDLGYALKWLRIFAVYIVAIALVTLWLESILGPRIIEGTLNKLHKGRKYAQGSR